MTMGRCAIRSMAVFGVSVVTLWCMALGGPRLDRHRPVVNVRDCGARGDGRTDDRAAIQSAIDALAAKDGGVLRMPRGTYLLDSYRPATHPWGFYNLLVGSRIHIEGEPGAILLQGEHGRAPLPDGATAVMNSVLVVGTPQYSIVTCQNPDFNGGFLPLLPTTAGASGVTLANPADVSRFAAGDYAAIYATTNGDVLPTELTRIAAVTAKGGLTLASPLARSFPSPSIANVTRLITTDVSLKGLTIQGAVPLTVMETYGFTAEGCRFLADTTVRGSNAVTIFNCNTMRSFRFTHNEMASVGPRRVAVELPQRNSQDGVFERNTFHVVSLGFGEYGAHWQFVRNHLWLHPEPETAVAISITGLDVLFTGNDVHCEELSGGEGWGTVLTDFYAPGDYAPYIGQIRVTDNTFDCKLRNAYCLRFGSRDPVAVGNRIRCTGVGTAIRSDGTNVAATIARNDVAIGNGSGILMEGGGSDGSVLVDNRLSAARGDMAIHIAAHDHAPRQRIERNTFSGFRHGVVKEPASPSAAARSSTRPPEPAGMPQGSTDAPTVTSSVHTVGDRKYTVWEYADPATKTFCVVIPEGLKKVRGLLVESNYMGGDSRYNWTFCHYYREFMHLHDFAMVGAFGTAPHATAFRTFRACLEAVARASGHPELVNAPYAAVGFSSGGGFASTLLTMDPARTIAAGIIEARYNFRIYLPPNPPPSDAVLKDLLPIPSVLCVGGKGNPEAQTGVYKMVDEVFVPYRPKGAQYAWMVLPSYGHEYAENRQDVLIMPILDLAVRTRYPRDADVAKGPIHLLAINTASGWIADNTTWGSGLTQIVPARQFKGDLGHSSWLQNEDIAFIYRAYATFNNPIRITSPRPCGPGTEPLEPGSSVTVEAEASAFPDWRKLELYDGAKRLGTVTAAPIRWTAENLTPGYHVFSILGTDAAGTVRTSDPVMVVVRAPKS